MTHPTEELVERLAKLLMELQKKLAETKLAAKPTIHELEKILAESEPPKVQLMPDGSVATQVRYTDDLAKADALYILTALDLPALLEQARAEEREQAEQTCRYMLKHQNFPLSEEQDDYQAGFTNACQLCEEAIRAKGVADGAE